MRDRSGFSLVELMVALAISGLMMSIATIAGVRWVESARISRASSQLVDYIVLAREKAISGYQQWRVTFSSTGGSVAESFSLDYCQATAGQKLGEPCAGTWVPYKTSIPVEQGIGLTIRDMATGNPVSEIRFDRGGYFVTPTVDITICEVSGEPSSRYCKDTDNPMVRIHNLVGSVELCPKGVCLVH